MGSGFGVQGLPTGSYVLPFWASYDCLILLYYPEKELHRKLRVVHVQAALQSPTVCRIVPFLVVFKVLPRFDSVFGFWVKDRLGFKIW